MNEKKIIDTDLVPGQGQVLKVLAFAGTGKTTTLVAYARKRPRMRFLYLAFNKSVQLEAAVDPDQAGILLTTAHKAKGLELDNVLIMDDFIDLIEWGQPIDPAGVDPDEFNLIYVAVTRARVHLRFHKDSSIPLFINWFNQKNRC